VSEVGGGREVGGRVVGDSSPEQACRGVCAHSIEGGELFERIVDEDYHLTEVDTMVFVRQICDGILFMHKMRVLHLDLKVLHWGLLGGSRGSLGPPGVSVVASQPSVLLSFLLHLSFHSQIQRVQ
jgi:hypothetical protein